MPSPVQALRDARSVLQVPPIHSTHQSANAPKMQSKTRWHRLAQCGSPRAARRGLLRPIPSHWPPPLHLVSPLRARMTSLILLLRDKRIIHPPPKSHKPMEPFAVFARLTGTTVKWSNVTFVRPGSIPNATRSTLNGSREIAPRSGSVSSVDQKSGQR